MDTKFSWREVPSHQLPKRTAAERIGDFLEVYGCYDEADAREQASRCVQCPNPSCISGCPLCNPIPQWMLLTAEGRFLEAAAVLGSATNMAEICARLCTSERLCEGECVLSGISEPVAIRAVEQFLCDYALAHGELGLATAPPNGHKVAVVGSGPGALACADDLAGRGFSVTVYDSALVPGGLLVNGMPAFKLERSIVQRRFDILRQRGITFRLGMKLGTDYTLASLREQYSCVYLGLDCRQARALDVPGADLTGVVPALPFLLQKNTALHMELPPLPISGKRVLVLGGGDTAIDCLRTAIRCGAQQAICLYRREAAQMPCAPHEYQNAVEEGAHFFFSSAPLAIVGDAGGRVVGLKFCRTELGAADPAGRRPVALVETKTFEIPADIVIPALGFEALRCPAEGGLQELTMSSAGAVIVDGNQMTNLPGVFAGGDLVRGPTLLLDSVRDGRRAAASIHARVSAYSSTTGSP